MLNGFSCDPAVNENDFFYSLALCRFDEYFVRFPAYIDQIVDKMNTCKAKALSVICMGKVKENSCTNR